MMTVENKLPITSAPREGTPIYLVFRDLVGEWTSLVPHAWAGKRWVSVRTGLPVTSVLSIVGWLPSDASDTGGLRVQGAEA